MLPLYAILDTYREKKTPKVLRFIYVLVLMQARVMWKPYLFALDARAYRFYTFLVDVWEEVAF